ncbi:MAG: hypothetical protein ABGX07_10820 [Pirellulaceae bacterium]|nr:hypothetical protein [Planctomycetaceae bacterium]HIM29266.1 hypothetical protein [Planctomycetota bacterium]
MQQFSRSSPAVLRWSARQILRWNETCDDVTVLHIHGELDRVLPIRCVDPDEVVAGGGHIISMTQGHIVNEFLRKQIA